MTSNFCPTNNTSEENAEWRRTVAAGSARDATRIGNSDLFPAAAARHAEDAVSASADEPAAVSAAAAAEPVPGRGRIEPGQPANPPNGAPDVPRADLPPVPSALQSITGLGELRIDAGNVLPASVLRAADTHHRGPAAAAAPAQSSRREQSS